MLFSSLHEQHHTHLLLYYAETQLRHNNTVGAIPLTTSLLNSSEICWSLSESQSRPLAVIQHLDIWLLVNKQIILRETQKDD